VLTDRRPRYDDEGMTLVELVIGMALLSMVLAMAGGFLVTAQNQENFVSQATRQQADARLALERVSRNVREATYPEGYGVYNSSVFAGADKYELTFHTDVDRDGQADRVRYWLDTTTGELRRSVVAPNCAVTCAYTGPARTDLVLGNVRNHEGGRCSRPATTTAPLFRFWKGNPKGGGVEILTPAALTDQLVDINFVQITVQIDQNPDRPPACQSITTNINVRNWRGS
jgi:prepilin-type N-terminal cleavage/methylation domain-containing protein